MNIHGQPHRSIEADHATQSARIIDQTFLPHQVEWRELRTLDDAAEAIQVMRVRGAPLIGATAAFGLFFALREDATDAALEVAYHVLHATRPTAINLRWALDRVRRVVSPLGVEERAAAAWDEALAICEHDVETNHAIGRHGLELFRAIQAKKGDPAATLNVMTHCNAGWLATVDWGTAISPIYQAHDAGMNVHVWVSETRPRGQGASLTAFELKEHGVPHTLIVDNNAGHLLQRGLVDVVIVGTDRVTAEGDVANKIGTYLKALAAKAHDVPFYVATPVSTIDWTITDGIRDIPIEQRSAREVTHMPGLNAAGLREEVLIAPEGTQARNDGFDVTPASLVTALVTEHGAFLASADALQQLRSMI
ncbi:S-methyl-5-thioribose-1-phosphate isomerase [Prosthecobacter sp.]|uniref:S-methyl-5-thioribose-1-phosphate isomerase n=1 Tax=Prosthecobacter sp. TaxID=1965333 RepID=UPI002486F9F7|nr:S-methyl-5-thioribose-1-phosphate isomerase [Prosthecobacter sp.]MDI1312724.1 S-methyl-5-thioribose-1-phosphate isomerase [Prosthecobacter sp.]